jgi:WD40 repeat protein
MPELPRIFISYAHRDGGDLAVRLQCDLEALGFEVWFDKNRLLGGDVWAKEIETAIDCCDAALALLSTGSFESDICRAEQERSLARRKLVIPVRVQRDCDVPLPLQTRQYIDFSDPANYAESFEGLLKGIRERRGVVAPVEGRPRYNNSPPLPDNFVDRPEILAELRNFLFQEAPNRNIALTALQGMGGIGKTVLARALCRDQVVEDAYPDGIFWFTIGKESRQGFDQRIEGVPGLHRLLGAYKGADACLSQYRNALRDKAALIVLDDVWSADHIEPFRTESPRSRLLVTTRDAGIAPTFGARAFTANLPAEGEGREMLARWAGLEVEALPPQAKEALGECGNLPLALAMIGAQLKGKPAGYWDIVLGDLRRADLAKIKARFPEPHTTLFRAIEVSVDALEGTAKERYLRLAVLLEDMAAAPAVQQTLWNVDEGEALETAERFVGLSLAQRDEPSGGIRLHDLQLDYVRAQYPHRDALELIHGAMRLSAHVIEKDPRQFASQLVGRLLPHRSAPAIQQFIEEIAAGAPAPWLRPLKPALHPPGTPLLRTLEGHSADVRGVAVTPDGKRAVSASGDHTLKVWDLETGRALRRLEGHSDHVFGVAVTPPDGKRAVSASGDHTLKVWDLETGRGLRTLQGHSAIVSGVAVTPDGKRAVSASWDKTLKVWDLEIGRALRTLEGHSSLVFGVAVTPDGKRAVSASWDHTLKVWDLETGRALRTLEGHSAGVSGVAVTADGHRVLSASWDRTLKVWDLATGRALRTLKGHSDYVSGVAVTADGKRAVSASWDHTLKVWDLATGRALRTLEGHSLSVSGVAVTPDRKWTVSASRDKTLKVWDLESGRAVRRLEGHSAPVFGVAVTPDGKRAVSASRDKTLKEWDLKSGRALRTLEGHSAPVLGVAVTPDGKRAVSASLERTLKVWDLATGRALRTLQGHSAHVSGVAVTPDGKWAVSASGDHTLKVWDLDAGRALRTLEGHSDGVRGVAVTPDGKRAVSASWDHTLKVWELETGRALRTLEGHSAFVFGVAVTPDGKRVVSASSDKTLKVWDLESGRALGTLEGHSASVRGVAVTPDGKRAVSASWDHTLKVWDLDTGLLIATFHCDAPARCCACGGERRIVAGDAGGRVYILSLEESGAPGAAPKATA